MAAVQTTAIYDELLDFLAGSPSQEEILAFKPSDEIQTRLSHLLDKNRNDRLSDEENTELDELLRLGHLVNMLKIRVRKKLAGK